MPGSTFDATPLQDALAKQTPPYDPGPIDGVFGTKTQAAMNHWQRDHGLEETYAPVAEVFIGLGIPLPPDMPEPPAAPVRSLSPIEEFALRVGLSLLLSKLFPGKDINVDTILATVKSAWLSKLNWTMAVGVLFNIFMAFGHPVPDDIQAAVLTLGNSAVLVLGWVIKTWFTTSITPSSAKKL